MSTALRLAVWGEVADERQRAHDKHADKSMESFAVDDLMRLSILLEEVGEVAREFNDGALHRGLNRSQLREELVQVAAMAGAWADAIHHYHDGPSCPICPVRSASSSAGGTAP